MDRHAVGDRRAPGGIGPGVEVAGELDGGQPALHVAGEARGHPRRVALGGGAHRFRPRVGAAHRPVEQPGSERDQGLQREVELAAEAAAAAGRDDADAVLGEAHDQRDLVAIHVGRLGAGRDLEPLAFAPREAGLGLDIGMLDEAGLPAALGDRRGGGQPGGDVALRGAAAHQDVVRPVGMQRRRAVGERLVDGDQRRQRFPFDRQVGIGDAVERGGVADQRHHRLAAIAH